MGNHNRHDWGLNPNYQLIRPEFYQLNYHAKYGTDPAGVKPGRPLHVDGVLGVHCDVLERMSARIKHTTVLTNERDKPLLVGRHIEFA
jgi:hypothetical protein